MATFNLSPEKVAHTSQKAGAVASVITQGIITIGYTTLATTWHVGKQTISALRDMYPTDPDRAEYEAWKANKQ